MINYKIILSEQWWNESGLRICESSQTILLCIAGELAWGGSVAVAVGVSDTWQVASNIQYVKPDTWHLTNDTWNLKIVFFLFSFSVSRMLDFKIIALNIGLLSYHHHHHHHTTTNDFLSILYPGFIWVSSPSRSIVANHYNTPHPFPLGKGCGPDFPRCYHCQIQSWQKEII